MNITHAAAAILVRDGTVLVAHRPAHKDVMPDYWEFPGGKLEAGETPEQAVIRELEEEIGVTDAKLEAFRFLSETRYPDNAEAYHVIVYIYIVRAWQGEPVGAEGQAIDWVSVDALEDIKLLPANAPLIPLLREVV